MGFSPDSALILVALILATSVNVFVSHFLTYQMWIKAKSSWSLRSFPKTHTYCNSANVLGGRTRIGGSLGHGKDIHLKFDSYQLYKFWEKLPPCCTCGCIISFILMKAHVDRWMKETEQLSKKTAQFRGNPFFSCLSCCNATDACFIW